MYNVDDNTPVFILLKGEQDVVETTWEIIEALGFESGMSNANIVDMVITLSAGDVYCASETKIALFEALLKQKIN